VEQRLRASSTLRITPGEHTRVRRYQVEIIGQFDQAPQVLVNGQPAQVVLESGRAQITVPGGEVVELTVR